MWRIGSEKMEMVHEYEFIKKREDEGEEKTEQQLKVEVRWRQNLHIFNLF